MEAVEAAAEVDVVGLEEEVAVDSRQEGVEVAVVPLGEEEVVGSGDLASVEEAVAEVEVAEEVAGSDIIAHNCYTSHHSFTALRRYQTYPFLFLLRSTVVIPPLGKLWFQNPRGDPRCMSPIVSELTPGIPRLSNKANHFFVSPLPFTFSYCSRFFSLSLLYIHGLERPVK